MQDGEGIQIVIVREICHSQGRIFFLKWNLSIWNIKKNILLCFWNLAANIMSLIAITLKKMVTKITFYTLIYNYFLWSYKRCISVNFEWQWKHKFLFKCIHKKYLYSVNYLLTKNLSCLFSWRERNAFILHFDEGRGKSTELRISAGNQVAGAVCQIEFRLNFVHE